MTTGLKRFWLTLITFPRPRGVCYHCGKPGARLHCDFSPDDARGYFHKHCSERYAWQIVAETNQQACEKLIRNLDYRTGYLALEDKKNAVDLELAEGKGGDSAVAGLKDSLTKIQASVSMLINMLGNMPGGPALKTTLTLKPELFGLRWSGE